MTQQAAQPPPPQQHPFVLRSDLTPRGDQPRAIAEIVEAFGRGEQHQTLLGVTGSGKTFTAAQVIAQLGLPTLVIAHNKTLAAQLHEEFKVLFPNNAVEYFVSYYDYYQPEAYVPSTDTYIAKDSSINDAIDRMRHAATRALFERNDVIIVSSVSCIYGLGSAEAYYGTLLFLQTGDLRERSSVIRQLVDIQYERGDVDFHRGSFRVRGDVVEIFPVHEAEQAVRVAWFGDEIEAIELIDPLRGVRLESLNKIAIYPTTHYVVTPETQQRALIEIRQELKHRLQQLRSGLKLLEAQRLEQRTLFDLEMIEQMGRCAGIENYSRHFTGRAPGQAPPTLMDYFPKDYLLIIDESHQTIPQIGAMFRGDQSRKTTLVEHGFRLPSALDNRPLRFDEFEQLVRKALYISATPADYELTKSHGVVVEQIIRPTGLVDPQVHVRPAKEQVDDLLEEIRLRVAKKQRVLVTTLTKRMAEDLTDYYTEAGVKVRYLHADIDTLKRIELLRDLRLGEFDVLVGINLLREGLDLPEVALVAILDADKEGFLRSARSLIQTIGRAARNIDGTVLLYADSITPSMRQAIDETERRRQLQLRHNAAHGITPRTVERAIRELPALLQDDTLAPTAAPASHDASAEDINQQIAHLRTEMKAAAARLAFERAAQLRDQIRSLEELLLKFG